MAARQRAPHLEPNLLPTRSFSPPIQRANFPSICMNNNGTVVLFYQRSRRIYYIVGSLTVEQRQAGGPPRYNCDWGPVRFYSAGCNVQVAINDNDKVVVVRSRSIRRRIVGQVGTVELNNKSIDWGEETFFRKGTNPAVALKDDTIILVHERNFGLYRSFYNLAKISDADTIEVHGMVNHPLPCFDECKEISVSINAQGIVLFSCRRLIGRALMYEVGRLADDEKSIDNLSQVERYASGYYSRVCLLDDRTVIEVHEKWTPKNACLYKYGRLREDNKTIDWDEDKEFDQGYNPCVAVCNDYRMITAHVSRSYVAPGELSYKFGTLTETS